MKNLTHFLNNKVVFTFIVIFGFCQNIVSQTYVNWQAAGSNNGSSWANAYINLQDALDSGAEIIWVAQGTYKPSQVATEISILINSNVELYGGFEGTESSIDQRDIENHPTILSGDHLDNDFPGEFTDDTRMDNAVNVVYINPSTSYVLVDGFIISGGHASIIPEGNQFVFSGAGIYSNADLNINNCTFQNNHAATGASVYVDGLNNTIERLDISNCSFERNLASNQSAGVFVQYVDSVSVQNTSFNNNQTNRGSFYPLYCGNVDLNSCDFLDNIYNQFDDFSCGIFSWNNDMVKVMDCSFDANFTGYATAIYIDGTEILDSQTELLNCVFDSNVSLNSGGCISVFESEVSIDSCSFLSNNASTDGGAIYASTLGNNSGSIEIFNSNFMSNNANFGGAIRISGSDQLGVLFNNYFNQNTANLSGGAIIIAFDADVYSENNILDNNIANFGGAVYTQNNSKLTSINNNYLANMANNIGGGLFFSGNSDIIINKDTISGNEAQEIGGGIYSNLVQGEFSGNLLIENAVLSNNSSMTIGGIGLRGFSGEISNSVFFENTANTGAAIGFLSPDTISASLEVINCTIVDNESLPDGATVLVGNVNAFAQINSTFANNLFHNTNDDFFSYNPSIDIVSLGGNYSTDDSTEDYFTQLTDNNSAEIPEFVDQLNNNYRLPINSNVVDEGKANVGTVFDFDQDLRSPIPDPGAFEGTIMELPETIYLCDGENATLSPGNFESYLWSTGDTIASILVDAAGTYSVTLTDSKGSIDSISTDVLFSTFDNVSVTANPPAICVGDNSTLIVSGATSVEWLHPDIPIDQVNDFTVTVAPEISTTYLVIVSNVDECIDTLSVTLTVNDGLNPSIIASDTVFCEDDELMLEVLDPNNIYETFNWSNGATTQSITTIANSSTTSFSVTVSDGSGCQGTTEISGITIHDRPSALIMTTPNPPVITGELVGFNAVNNTVDVDCGNIENYNWFFYEDNTIQGSVNYNQASFDTSFTSEDISINTIGLVVEDQCGCSSEEYQTNFNIIASESCGASIELPDKRCVDVETILLALPSEGTPAANKFFLGGYFIINGQEILINTVNTTFDGPGWEFTVNGINSIYDFDAKDEVNITFTKGGIYNIEYYVDFNACQRTVSFPGFSVSELPEFSGIDMDNAACFDESPNISFDIQESTFDWDLSYTINDGGTNIKNFIPSSSKNISLSNIFTQNEGNITLEFIELLDRNTGCVSELNESQSIEVYGEPEFLGLDTICEFTTGNYEVFVEILKGSSDFSLLNSTSLGSFDNNHNEYYTNFIPADQTSTATFSDNGCIDDFTFELETAVSCECPGKPIVLEDIIYRACSSDEIELTTEEAGVPVVPNSTLFYHTYEKVSGQEVKIDSFVQIDLAEQENIKILFNEAYKDGEVYFIKVFLTRLQNDGSPDTDFRCIESSEEVRFIFYHDPEPEISGLESVCKNANDIFYSLQTLPQKHEYQWDINGNVNVIESGEDYRLLDFLGGDVDISVTEFYYPLDPDQSFSCVAEDQLSISVSEASVPEVSTILLFLGDLLICDEDEENFCFDWYAVNKNTGQIVINGPETKQWFLETQIDTSNLVYVCEVFTKINGNCDKSAGCTTKNYFNSNGLIIGTFDIEVESMKVYPNPSTEIFTLENISAWNDELTIQVFDMLGNSIPFNYKLSENKMEIRILSETSGMYHVHIFDVSQKSYKQSKLLLIK